jgi:cytoskeletal protein CcmA (bactofilin family)
MKKYELTNETTQSAAGATLYRIKSLIKSSADFGIIDSGELGGFVESEDNLAHDGQCWISDNAQVSGNARVFGRAQVSGNAKVFGDAWVAGEVQVYDNAQVYGNARISGSEKVYGDMEVKGDEKSTQKEGKNMLNKIEKFQRQAKALGRDENSVEEFKMWLKAEEGDSLKFETTSDEEVHSNIDDIISDLNDVKSLGGRDDIKERLRNIKHTLDDIINYYR